MTEVNSLPPTKVTSIDGQSFKVHVDATKFGCYEREGMVESVKMPKQVSFHSLKESIHNPVASTEFGMLQTPDLRFFGRSEQLHLAFSGIWRFQ